MDLYFRDIEPVCICVCVSVQVGKGKELIEDYFLSFPFHHFPWSQTPL